MDEFMRQLHIVSIERRPEACLGCGFEHRCSTHGCAVIKTASEQLKAYRATNHTPEECAAAFEELAAYHAAEQDGTLLRLPCKVGDMVYVLIPADCGFCDKEQCENIFPCRKSYLVKTEFSADLADDVGKTIFLTREAAEAALKEQEAQK